MCEIRAHMIGWRALFVFSDSVEINCVGSTLDESSDNSTIPVQCLSDKDDWWRFWQQNVTTWCSSPSLLCRRQPTPNPRQHTLMSEPVFCLTSFTFHITLSSSFSSFDISFIPSKKLWLNSSFGEGKIVVKEMLDLFLLFLDIHRIF